MTTACQSGGRYRGIPLNENIHRGVDRGHNRECAKIRAGRSAARREVCDLESEADMLIVRLVAACIYEFVALFQKAVRMVVTP